MECGLAILWLVSVVELLAFLPFFWHGRRTLALLSAFANVIFLEVLLASTLQLETVLIAIISLYRLFNLAKLYAGRQQSDFLYRSTVRTSISLITFQIIVFGSWKLYTIVQPSNELIWLKISGLQVVFAAGILIVTWRNLRMARQNTMSTVPQKLPTLTVCVPARNETESMADCLQALTKSDYPKLEILVLDDCSQDRTPDIIRDFAHAGVRFIRGKQPPTNWQAKNWAYNRLFEEANGELLLFCGVDIRFAPGSLRAIVTRMQAMSSRMISVMPQNKAANAGHGGALLLQPMRYAWELCLPRQLLRRPSVLSSCWLAERTLLQQAGGFAAVSGKLLPEAYFAKLADRQQKYRFVAGDHNLAIHSLKLPHDQWDTAVRTRYPQLHRKPELVLLVSASQFFLVLMPIIIFIAALLMESWMVSSLAAISLGMLSTAYSLVLKQTYTQLLPASIFILLASTLLDIIIRNYSMYRYEFKSVSWKNREVSLPTMQVIPHLPKL